MNVELLNPNDLEYIQSRVDKHEDKIEEYKDLMADGHEFGACQGIRDASGKVLIYDGYHRGEAVKRLGGRMLLVDVMNGDRDLAEWLSLSSNTTHGIPRSTADKAKVVMAALQSPMAVAMSNRQIAHHCGVDESTIRNYRKKLESANNAEIPQADKSKTNGTTPSPAALPLMPIPVDTTRKLTPAEEGWLDEPDPKEEPVVTPEQTMIKQINDKLVGLPLNDLDTVLRFLKFFNEIEYKYRGTRNFTI